MYKIHKSKLAPARGNIEGALFTDFILQQKSWSEVVVNFVCLISIAIKYETSP
jgi:hypothetical protein